MTLPKIHNFYNELQKTSYEAKTSLLMPIMLPIKFQPFLSSGLAATTFCCFIFRS